MVDPARRVASERRELEVRRQDVVEAGVGQQRGMRRDHPLPDRHGNRRDEGEGGIRRRRRQSEGGDQLVDGEAGHGVGFTE